MNKPIMISFFLLLVIAFTGCDPKTTRVSGTVTQNGVGLKDIVVLLQPVSDAPLPPEAAYGKTDERGRFELVTILSKRKGLVPGEYSVSINWKDPNMRHENEPPNPCPYKIPTSASSGSHNCKIEAERTQTLDFELSEFVDNPANRKR